MGRRVGRASSEEVVLSFVLSAVLQWPVLPGNEYRSIEDQLTT